MTKTTNLRLRRAMHSVSPRTYCFKDRRRWQVYILRKPVCHGPQISIGGTVNCIIDVFSQSPHYGCRVDDLSLSAVGAVVIVLRLLANIMALIWLVKAGLLLQSMTPLQSDDIIRVQPRWKAFPIKACIALGWPPWLKWSIYRPITLPQGPNSCECRWNDGF